MLWFEASTVVPMAPPVGATAGASVLRSALAGGLASGLSTCVMHPLDTIKVQSNWSTMAGVVPRYTPTRPNHNQCTIHGVQGRGSGPLVLLELLVKAFDILPKAVVHEQKAFGWLDPGLS